MDSNQATVGRSIMSSSKRMYDVLFNRKIIFYIFLLPLISLLLIFGIWPIAQSILVSFTDSYTALSDAPKYIGFNNYKAIFNDKLFVDSLRITIQFTFMSVPINMLLAFVFALALSSKALKHGRTLFRLAVFLPVITSDLVVSIVWRWMYNTEYGAVNTVLQSLGLQPFGGLASPQTVLLALMFVALWKNVGLYTVIFMTNIQLIDPVLYESADIDGANYPQKVWHITIPELRPAILLNSIYAVIQFLKVFTLARVMTGGGPNFSSNFTAFYAYERFSKVNNFGEATAMGTILFLIVIIVFMLTYWLNRRGTQ